MVKNSLSLRFSYVNLQVDSDISLFIDFYHKRANVAAVFLNFFEIY